MTDPSSTEPRRTNGLPMRLLLALVLGVVLFGAGWYVGQGPVAGLRSNLNDTTKQRDDARVVALVQSTRASLYQSAADLDRRNFGTANTNLQNAAATLARVPADRQTSDLRALQSRIAATNVNVAVDLRQQRTTILDFADRVTRLAANLPPLPGSAGK
ncbi:hypothetical protein [Deinococcus yavapaiensis]|uniref:Uncharacterized protein n=1 Tax=Deinococcus yavapaiensis KR-236 TaxID=694435 RepID=A0A318SD82_9DEIO|nr:hypothetical protein [Deinococcus yavapaiensis]PYE56593.1 hypothetical protein DES52_101398 [Deinococcus yavapaiensis KR-236]